MAKGFRVQYDADHFRIVGPDGAAGEVADMGGVSSIRIGRQIYVCALDIDVEEGEVPGDQNEPELLGPGVYLLGPEQATTFEEVEFEIPGEPGAGEGDGEPGAVVVEEDGGEDDEEEGEPEGEEPESTEDEEPRKGKDE